MEQKTITPKSSQRFMSIDALRGFIMFFIIGGDELIKKIAEHFNNPTFNKISENFTSHVDWEGLHFYDMIFPAFLFLIGVVIPFSLGKRIEEGASKKLVVIKVVKRTLILFTLGLIDNGLLEFEGFYHLRIMGVLQRLALGYFFASLIMLFCKKIRWQVVIFITILAGYWAALTFIPIPNGIDLPTYIDRMIFAPGQLLIGDFDPEGLFSTIPAIATAILGLLTGQWLKSQYSKSKKLIGLVVGGLVCVGLGFLWGIWFPLVKNLWTSSYVLAAGGFSLLMLATFYCLIELLGLKKWAYFFVVIGVNAITIYFGQAIINFEDISESITGGMVSFFPLYSAILIPLSVLLVKWLFLNFLHRKKLYFRV